jgi:hypothetical protein
MSDITKISESYSKDPDYHDWDAWPYPTVCIESVVSGELRSRILTALDWKDDGSELHLVETKISSGWSEYTPEDDCEIAVMIGSQTLWESKHHYNSEPAMAAFMQRFAAGDQR